MVQLIELLAGRNLAKLLVFFLQNPSAELSQVQVSRKVGLAKATLVKWLRRLVNAGVLSMRVIGATNLYSLRRESSVVRQLKIAQNLSLLSGLKKVLGGHEIKAYLYGSAARGEDVESSDFDVLVIGVMKRETVIGEINKLASTLKKGINLSIFSAMEWSEMSRKDKPFYERVEKDKVEL
ncbi:nucleotidyltransferase domain-containing protein [Candidatus Woesearchaeota archaeon]|nr:nucleotidyltransferase domain-containing protein [Candidatus Woesearchaeota archaeon]